MFAPLTAPPCFISVALEPDHTLVREQVFLNFRQDALKMKHSSDAPLQQAQALCGALDQLRELGVDPREACAGLAFGEEDLTPDAMIPFGDGVAFLENCQKLTGLEQFGLLAGARGDHRSFGAIGQLMDVAPTLGHAIRDFLSVQVGISLGATTYCYPLGEYIALGYGIFERHHPSAIQVYGLTMAVGANMVRALTGGDVNPLEIHFCHRPPADPGVYRQVLENESAFRSVSILPDPEARRSGAAQSARRRAASCGAWRADKGVFPRAPPPLRGSCSVI